MSKAGVEKMNFNASWSMAVGGMIGGGIFSVLGVIVFVAGQWAWLSFVIAGLIALISAHSYSQLSIKYEESGGAFTYLRKTGHKGFAASLAWILILGYILTISVYSFTFGHYIANVFNFGNWFTHVLSVFVIALLTLLNLRGVGDSSRFEIIAVWGKLLVLLTLAIFGLVTWNTAALTENIEAKPIHSSIIGAATIFMAYEGFQLLSYDYDDINDPRRTMPRATVAAVISVIFIYVMVCLGATMLVGAAALIEKKEVALSIAGRNAMGNTGLVLVTIAAAFSTGSAINATLFATARLMENVAQKNNLPLFLAKENKSNIPYYAVILIAVVAAILASSSSLETLVDAASLIFLLTFGIVNFIAWQQKVKYRAICLVGSLGCIASILFSAYELFLRSPILLFSIITLLVLSVILRPWLIKKINE